MRMFGTGVPGAVSVRNLAFKEGDRISRNATVRLQSGGSEER